MKVFSLKFAAAAVATVLAANGLAYVSSARLGDPIEAQALLDHMIAQGFAQPAHRKLFSVVTRVEDVMPALSRQPEPVIKPETKWL